MYSATFVGHVGRLAQNLLREPQRVDVASHTDTHDNIEQRLHWADNGAHKNALLDHILTEREMEQALVFTSTQRDADWLADRLADMGHAVASLHGGMPQGRRNRVLQGLRSRQLRVLVATDVAARGIDVPTISHVINYGLPMKPEDYVHRIGRTGRAGRNGLAVTLAERMDAGMIRRIQQFTTQTIPVATIAGLEPKSPEPRIANGRARAQAGPCTAPGRRAPRRDERAERGRSIAPRAGRHDRAAGASDAVAIRSIARLPGPRRAPSRVAAGPASFKRARPSRRGRAPAASALTVSGAAPSPRRSCRGSRRSRRTSCPRSAPPATGRARRRRGSADVPPSRLLVGSNGTQPAPGR